MAAPSSTEPVRLKSSIVSLPLNVLCNRIIDALSVDYDSGASSTAAEYISAEMEDSQELIDDLEAGHLDSGLVDCIMTASGIPTSSSLRLTELLITAVNGDWQNTKVTKVGAIPFIPVPVPDDLQRTKEWLSKQWDDKVFESYDQNLDLMKLFAIGKKQNMASLPGVLHEVYSQWRINYLIDRKKKGKKTAQPVITDFIRKSAAFKDIHSKNKQLVASGVATYGRRFSPQPIINHLFEIRDSLYDFVLYSYIMSEAIHNLISSNGVILPLQIDFWIIPKEITTKIEDDDEKNINIVEDQTILNIHKRLKLDNTLKYTSTLIDINKSQTATLTRTLQNMIGDMIDGSHNRLVCICDRRNEYHDFKILPKSEKDKYLGINTEKNNDSLPPIIECDKTKKHQKINDEIFIFKPPQKYGVLDHDYSQEHLQYLSREYMFPKVILKNPQCGYKQISGTYNDFDSQMFTISFCCHSITDVRLQWFINGWNMRIPKTTNFIKIWPEFFAKTKQNIEAIDRIKKDILRNWKLQIKNKEYEMYEQDLLRFQNKRGKKQHD